MKNLIGKELIRVLKDKKMVFSLFILPAILVVGMFGLVGYLVTQMMSDVKTHVPLVTVVDAPEGFRESVKGEKECDIRWVTSENYTDESLEETKQLLMEGDWDLIVVFPAHFDEKALSDSTKPVDELLDVKTYYNPSEDYSSEAHSLFVDTFLANYRTQLLVQRYGSLNETDLFTIDATNEESVVQDDNKAVGKLLGMLIPYFISILIFASAMGLGTDMIAGEKERGTLAAMILTPISRTKIVMSKVIALTILSVLSSAVYIASMLGGLPMAFGGLSSELGGVSISFHFLQILQIVILMVGQVLFYVSIVCLVSVWAKNTKEASTMILPVYMIIMVVGMLSMYATGKPSFAQYFIPIYGNTMALKDVFTQEILWPNFLAATAATYLSMVVLILVMVKAFQSEKILTSA